MLVLMALMMGVEHLQPAGTIPLAMISDTASDASVIDANVAQRGLHGLGRVEDADGDGGDDPTPFAVDDAGQVVAGPSTTLRRTRTQIACAGDDLEPQHVIRRDAYLRVRPPALVATLPPMDDTIWLDGSARRVSRFAEWLREPQVDHPGRTTAQRLAGRPRDAVHPIHPDHHAASSGPSARRSGRFPTARNDGEALTPTELHDGLHLGGGSRQGHGVGAPL